MYRFLLTPRWVGINLLALVAIPTCVLLGLWQLSRFQVHDRPSRPSHAAASSSDSASSAVPLAGLMAGADSSGVVSGDAGRRVTLTGSYDSAHQLLIPKRTADGQNSRTDRVGYYVLTPLRLASGGYVAVVRGWAPGPAPAAAPPAPAGPVSLTGLVEQSETEDSPQAIVSGSLPQGQLGMITATTMVNVLPYQVWDGWVALGAGAPGATGFKPVKLADATSASGGGLNLRAAQNLGYVGQWFVFAGFVVFMWSRLFRREKEQARDAELGLLAP